VKEKKDISKAKKKSKAELWEIREAYLKGLPESELNPNWKEDSEKLLSSVIKNAKPKAKTKSKPKQ
jgi:hypothetical protein